MATTVKPETTNQPALAETADDFASWTLDDARQSVDVLVTELEEVNEAFVEGDHWQDGNGWVGPRPRVTDTGADITMSEIEKAFVSRNVIGEVVERHTAFLVGAPPRWQLVPRRKIEEGKKPTDGEQRLIDEASDALTVWWDTRGVHQMLQDLVRMVLWAERSAFRLYVPSGMLTRREKKKGGETQVVTSIQAADITEALSKIWPDHPSFRQASVIENPDTKQQCGVFLFANDLSTASLDRAELSFLDGLNTVIKIIGDTDEAAREVRLSLGKRLPMFEITRPLLITEQIQESQRALNLAASMLPRNVVTGGFLERVLLNAQMPGHWEMNEKGDPTKFIPGEFETGAGTTNFVAGIQYKDPESGKQMLMTPDVKWREPVSVDPAIAAKEQHYKDILEEAKQGHIIAGTDSKLGWKSREQLRADSDKALDLTRAPTEACGRWLIETVLAMAEAFTGKPGLYTNQLRAEFSCISSSGPLASDDRKDNREAAKDGFLSRSTAMERNGVDDVDAELARIGAEETARIDLAVKQATAIKTLVDAGATIDGAAEYLGIDPKRAKLLAAGDVPPDPVPVA